MAFPIRLRATPQCSACLRSYAWAAFAESTASTSSSLRQQVRGKKKMPNHSATVTVRLNQDVKTFGKKGAIVPVERGRMRNQFYPQGIAEYVTVPEMKTIRLSGAPIERDFTYGIAEDARARAQDEAETPGYQEDPTAIRTAPARQTPKIERLTPERSVELVEIFVRPHLDFYRQPTPEEKEEKSEEEAPVAPEEKRRSASSAAADLLAARTHGTKSKAKSAGPRSIYGSVSTHDVLVEMRAAMATNDEAARVTFSESDIQFVDLPAHDESEAGRVKHLGDYAVEINIRGADSPVRRTIRVIPQEA